MISDPLIYVRIVHFAATITVSGVVFFIAFIAEAAFRQAGNGSNVAALVSPIFAWIAWIGLVVTVVSGGAWLVLVAQSMSDSSLSEVFSEGILWIVLLQTGFGRDWLARFVLACLLAATFVPFLSARGVKSVWIKVVAVALAVGVAGTLAWAGHAVGGSGIEAIVHPGADFLHLVAAAAWVGTLLPLRPGACCRRARRRVGCHRANGDSALLSIRHRQRRHPAGDGIYQYLVSRG